MGIFIYKELGYVQTSGTVYDIIQPTFHEPSVHDSMGKILFPSSLS